MLKIIGSSRFEAATGLLVLLNGLMMGVDLLALSNLFSFLHPPRLRVRHLRHSPSNTYKVGATPTRNKI